MANFVLRLLVVSTTLSSCCELTESRSLPNALLHWSQPCSIVHAWPNRSVVYIAPVAHSRNKKWKAFVNRGKFCRVCTSPQLEALSIFESRRVATRVSRKTTDLNASHSNLSQSHCHFHAQPLATITSQRPQSRIRDRPSTTSMATPQFPSRPFPGLGRTSTVGQQQQQQAPPNANTYQPTSYGGPSNTFNDRGGAGPGQRERQERERAERERIERERREAEERAGALDALSEEQREEINEAVSLLPTPHSEENKALIITVLPLRPRQRQPHRLPRTKSRPQSPRLRPPQIRNPLPAPNPRHPRLHHLFSAPPAKHKTHFFRAFAIGIASCFFCVYSCISHFG